jgi:diguanylate cyclase (GGDEF)-like protein/PAS domain S-box-containing protein
MGLELPDAATSHVRVLVVEDDPVHARLVGQLLAESRHTRFQITHAERLASALETARRGSVEAMLLDLGLPDANGLETLERAHAAAPNVPIIVISSIDDDEIVLEALQLGAQDYLVKGTLHAGLLERSIRWAVERTQTRAALQESEERFSLAVRGAKDGLWDWSFATDRIYYSPRWKAMLGYADEEITSTPREWFDRVHADDVERVRAELADHTDGRSATFESEYRIRHKDGTYRWVMTRGLAVRRASGQPHRIAGSQSDITDRKTAEQRLVHSAFHDTLTNLPNRTLFLDRLERAMLRRRRRAYSLLAVLSLDLDRFKVVNESVGHVAGDQLITAIAARLISCLRAEDTLSRLGGDQFAVLAEDVSDIREAVKLAERFQDEMSVPFDINGQQIFTSLSIGITTSIAGYTQPIEYLRDAEIAMHRAKGRGGACHQVFDAAMHERAVARLQLETELRRGLDYGEFCLYYQPIVHLTDAHIVGFEALLRWQHPYRGLLLPDAFLPVAEEMGLLTPIFKQVFPPMLEQLRTWQSLLPLDPPLFINFNLSGNQFASLERIDQIDALMEHVTLPPRSLGVEITESVLMQDTESARQMLLELRARNMRLYLDDFGTGYSSLSWLHRLPIDGLKIDRSFVADLDKGGDGIQIVRAIVMLAHNLGMAVTAEGIETMGQLEQVRLLACEQGQGFHFGRAVSAEVASNLIRAVRDVRR